MMPRRTRLTPPGVWVILALLGSISATSATGQVSAPESTQRLKPAAGLEATLWAAEPLLMNPTNIDVDSRGRVWVTEGLNYRLTRGGNKRFQRVDDSDKIKILEDTDGDGKADKVTVFADKIFPVPMGIAVEEHWTKEGKYAGCRVYVGNSPDLLVFEDTDGDDKADKRYPLLTGFGGIDSDHGVHGVTLGLDGKLYFTHGDGCCSVQQDHSERAQNFDVVDQSGRHVSSDQLANTLRVNRDGTQFEIICDRQRNNYETSLNAFGNIFTSDNDDDGNRGCRVIWAMDGGHYGYRTPGSPRHWGEEVPGNIPKLVGTGNGSPTGIMVYEGHLLPQEYHGAVFEVDSGTRQVNFFPIERHGAGFRTDYKVLLSSDDPWFRPVDATAAPDGSIIVADWYDAGVGGHAFSDQTTGRIFRVAPQGNKPSTLKADFSTIDGLIAALGSPNVATQDAARRSLIAHEQAAVEPLRKLFSQNDPILRARSLYVLAAIEGDSPVLAALKDADPRIREQAVRMLGRDCADNGKVEYTKPEARKPAPALAYLDALQPLAVDPDASVRRELILAFRNLPTDKVGDSLRTLATAWDGRDRWYLEALGLAFDHRESEFLASLFNSDLFGAIGDLDQAGSDASVALPPYFPVDRNEAFIPVGATDAPASPLSKSLGLAWRVHRPEVVPMLRKVVASLKAPDLQQAADDILRQIKAPAVAVLVSELIETSKEPVRKRELLAILARNLESSWTEARNNPIVERTLFAATKDPETRLEGIAALTATRDARYNHTFESIAGDESLPVEARVAAIQGMGELSGRTAKYFDVLIGSFNGKANSTPVVEAAVRVLPRIYDARSRLTGLLTSTEYPLGLRREALKTLADLQDGGPRIIELAREKRLPDDLKTDAVTRLLSHRDRAIRDAAAEVLPVPKLADGRPLPSIGQLMRREGHADKGRSVFFGTGANACATCHRVQGQGQWIGPDLSTIGTKYGKDELLRSILNPSDAIGYSYRSLILALNDGRVITGLPLEDTPDRLVVKTADGQRVVIKPGEVEDRATSDVSLMPEGLAQSMGEQDLVDLLAFLATLRQPVSIVGQYYVLGPVAEGKEAKTLQALDKIDLSASVPGPSGQSLSWRRIDANAEGQADLSRITGGGTDQTVYTYAAVTSPVAQKARIVVETGSRITAWLNGKPLIEADTATVSAKPHEVEIELPSGTSSLVVRLTGDGKDAAPASLVTTFVTSEPVSFATGDPVTTSR